MKRHLDKREAVSDLVALLVITFGIVLIAGGLLLIAVNPSLLSQSSNLDFTAKMAAGAINWVPGIPFNIGDLAEYSVSTVGLVLWVVGIDFLLIGLGLWVRHRVARLIMLAIFFVASYFQFIQFLFFGAFGSPNSVFGVLTNGFLGYLLLSKFDFAIKTTHIVEGDKAKI